MKKSHLICAVSAILFGGFNTTAFGSTPPTISGRLYLSMLKDDVHTKQTNLSTNTVTSDTTENRTKMHSSGSRLRFTGSQTMSEDVDLEYYLEYSIYVDDDSIDDKGQALNFSSRNTYLGLKHNDYGTIRVGRIFTPDDDIDYVDQSYLYGNGTGTSFSYNGQRTNNTIQYISPKWNNTQVKLHYSMDETESGGKFSSFMDGREGVIAARDFISGHILYENEDTKTAIGAAYTQAGSDFNALRVMASYKPQDKFTLGFMAQRTDYNSADAEIGAMVSGYYNINDNLDFYAQVGHAKHYGGFKDGEHTNASLGLIKWLKRDGTRVRVFGALHHNDVTKFAHITEADDDYQVGNLQKTQQESFGVEAGMRIDF